MLEYQMFKIIIENGKSKEVFYTRIDLSDFNHVRANLHAAIKKRLPPGFFTEENDPMDYELFWVDEIDDIILIRTWHDLYNYAAYLAPKSRKYLELFVKPLGNKENVLKLKQMKIDQNKIIERNLNGID